MRRRNETRIISAANDGLVEPTSIGSCFSIVFQLIRCLPARWWYRRSVVSVSWLRNPQPANRNTVVKLVKEFVHTYMFQVHHTRLRLSQKWHEATCQSTQTFLLPRITQLSFGRRAQGRTAGGRCRCRCWFFFVTIRNEKWTGRGRCRRRFGRNAASRCRWRLRLRHGWKKSARTWFSPFVRSSSSKNRSQRLIHSFRFSSLRSSNEMQANEQNAYAFRPIGQALVRRSIFDWRKERITTSSFVSPRTGSAR